MDNLSEAVAIVEQLLVNFLNAQIAGQAGFSGADQAKKAWIIVHQEFDQNKLADLAISFENQPGQFQQEMVHKLAKLMRKNDLFADQLRNLLDDYLQQIYGGQIDVKQEVSQISSASGATGGSVTFGINIEKLG